MTVWTDTPTLIKHGITSNRLLNRCRLWTFLKISLRETLPFNEFFLNWHLVRKKLSSAHAKARTSLLALGGSHFWNHNGFNPCLHSAAQGCTHRRKMKEELVAASPKGSHSPAYSDPTFWGKTRWQNQTKTPGENSTLRSNQPQFPSKNPWWGFQWNTMTNTQLKKKNNLQQRKAQSVFFPREKGASFKERSGPSHWNVFC